MAIDEADQSDAGDFSTGDASDGASDDDREGTAGAGDDPARVGDYTWADFMDEHGYGDEVASLYPSGTGPEAQLGLDTDERAEPTVPRGDDWDAVSFDPEAYLGFHPDDLEEWVLALAGDNRDVLEERFLEYVDPETTPVTKDVWTWEHYKWEYYYDDDGSRPRNKSGEIVRHDEAEALGFDPDDLEARLSAAGDAAMALDDVLEQRTVSVQEDIDEDAFFSNTDDTTTVANRYDLEKAVPLEKKTHFREVERYWVNKPYTYVVIFHSEKENEKKYYVIEPHLNEIETELKEFLSGKLRTAIKYSDESISENNTEDGRKSVIETETRRLLKRYDLFEKPGGGLRSRATPTRSGDSSGPGDDSGSGNGSGSGLLDSIKSLFSSDGGGDGDGNDSDATENLPASADSSDEARPAVPEEGSGGNTELEGISVRPEPVILAEDPSTLNEYQVEKLLYLLKRDFIGYERIDGIKHDINVEDISCDGYNSPVFVYHSEYEQIISNIYHGKEELDDFVVKLAQRSGKGISKRLPQVDATLPDGSRAQLTLGKEVSDHGTNYTIRQFKDVPFTPIDLINWNTFSLEEMAFLWLAIENHKSLIFAGGTASGKTTSLNAVSLFIPSSAKIVSIEDTREVELPQRNWIASVTRPSFSDDEQGDVDEFDLLEAALRQRPDYIVMGEIRGEEGRTLFQVMSTGHTTYTTFHADSVDEVLKRFTTDPINVSKTMFTALDLVSIQTQTRVQGRKVRRNKSLTEINHYEAEHDEINVQDVYQWQAETDEFLKMGDSNTLEEIRFDRGWSREKLETELFKRQVILAYLIKNGLNTYAEVAATVQAFINDPDTILTLIANGHLEDSLEDLREMESVLIDVDPEKEELVPRPDATDETYNLSTDILERAEESLFEEYRGQVPSGLASALGGVQSAPSMDDPSPAGSEPSDLEGETVEFEDTFGNESWEVDDSSPLAGGDAGEQPAWLTDDGGFDTADASLEGDADDETEALEDGEAPSALPGTDTEPASASEVGAAEGTDSELPVARDDERTADSIEADAEELDTLFDDMGETLEQIDDGRSSETAGTSWGDRGAGTAAPTDSSSMFPEGRLELPSSSDEDRADREDGGDDAGGSTTGDVDPSGETPETTAESPPDVESTGSPATALDGTQGTSPEPNETAADHGVEDESTDATRVAADAGDERDHSTAGGDADADEKPDGEPVGRDESTSGDRAEPADGEEPTPAQPETDADSSPAPTAESETPAESTDPNESDSIFGSGAGAPFGDDPDAVDDTDGDDGSLFDAAGDSTDRSRSPSVFGDSLAGDANSDDGDNGITTDDQETESAAETGSPADAAEDRDA
ncbi:ATPase, T2SS/T4P/T4SS family [Natrarchaeobaculum aegyptiacum]|uniref:Secretion system protein E n=1 Tax=Natrarchaeobaculum aegyptiacum TaxID=745377 RepID=A0A2Z2HPC2_9EURY|nr:ATPase, T2SS/T4P/T4SS family [Natrarchaeobaculum aegyptiacum]ARS88876.1 secretion system protein E [Natrarchaeobaculum aegyptiacum]